jgi:prepilin-type N-terminal cleavage/methylation domain-containing protein
MKKLPSTSHIHHGFTMIELLIVLAIMSTLMGLVGPLAISSLERAESKTELLKFENLIKKISILAFSEGKIKCIALKGRKLYLGCNEELPIEIVYEHLSFANQSFNFNRTGLPTQTKIQYRYKEQQQTLNIIDFKHDQN